jgi:hypothetical protein
MVKGAESNTRRVINGMLQVIKFASDPPEEHDMVE